jgi:hypothetical protein
MHRYIQKGVGIWELGRTRDTGTYEKHSPYQMTLLPLTPTCGLNLTMYSMYFEHKHAFIHKKKNLSKDLDKSL